MKNTIPAKIYALPLLFLTIFSLTSVSNNAQNKPNPVDGCVKVFKAIVGEKEEALAAEKKIDFASALAGNGKKVSSFTKTKLKQFLRENDFRDPAHNKDSFLYASDLSSMKANFQSGIFGDLVVKLPICDFDRGRTICWDVTVWGFNFENSNVPILIPDAVSDKELIEINTMIYVRGGKSRLDRKISIDAFADLLFDKMVEDTRNKEEVDGAYFLAFCAITAGRSVNASNIPSPNQTRNKVAEDKFTAPADSPIIGTWRYTECYNNDCNNQGNYSKYLTRTSTFIYSPNGVVESIHQNSMGTNTIKGNWKYIPKTAASGILEEYLGEDLVERATVKFLGSNQLEYTITFSPNSDAVGRKTVWTRQ